SRDRMWREHSPTRNVLGHVLGFRVCLVDYPGNAYGLGIAERGSEPLDFDGAQVLLAGTFGVLFEFGGRVESFRDKASLLRPAKHAAKHRCYAIRHDWRLSERGVQLENVSLGDGRGLA